MSRNAEKMALEILEGSSAYNQLFNQLEGEQRELLWKASWEQQILTMWQCIVHAKPLTCQAWRDKMHGWLMNVVRDYHKHFDDKEEGDGR